MSTLELASVYWCTRDEDAAGILSEMVNVWLVRPPLEPPPLEGGVVWEAPDDRYAQWSTAVCLKNCGTYPEDSRQVLKRG